MNRDEVDRLREGLERLRQQSENKSEAILTLLAALRACEPLILDAGPEAAVLDQVRAAIAEVEGPAW